MDIRLGTELNYWICFGIVSIVLVLLIYFWKENLLKRFIRYAFGVILAVFLIKNTVSLFLLYLAIKKSSLATYLLSGSNSFFVNHLVIAAESVGEVLILAVILYLAGWSLLRYKKSLVEKEFPLILASIGIITGISNILPVILLGLFLAILWQIIRARKQDKISLIPFLLFATITVNILNVFPFYQKFLENLHLV